MEEPSDQGNMIFMMRQYIMQTRLSTSHLSRDPRIKAIKPETDIG